MARNRPLVQIDISASFRVHPVAGVCCYLTVIAMEEDGQRTVLESRHLVAEPLALVDQVNELVRHWELEAFLPCISPF